jgi:hypothetical protein
MTTKLLRLEEPLYDLASPNKSNFASTHTNENGYESVGNVPEKIYNNVLPPTSTKSFGNQEEISSEPLYNLAGNTIRNDYLEVAPDIRFLNQNKRNKRPNRDIVLIESKDFYKQILLPFCNLFVFETEEESNNNQLIHLLQIMPETDITELINKIKNEEMKPYNLETLEKKEILINKKTKLLENFLYDLYKTYMEDLHLYNYSPYSVDDFIEGIIKDKDYRYKKFIDKAQKEKDKILIVKRVADILYYIIYTEHDKIMVYLNENPNTNIANARKKKLKDDLSPSDKDEDNIVIQNSYEIVEKLLEDFSYTTDIKAKKINSVNPFKDIIDNLIKSNTEYNTLDKIFLQKKNNNSNKLILNYIKYNDCLLRLYFINNSNYKRVMLIFFMMRNAGLIPDYITRQQKILSTNEKNILKRIIKGDVKQINFGKYYKENHSNKQNNSTNYTKKPKKKTNKKKNIIRMETIYKVNGRNENKSKNKNENKSKNKQKNYRFINYSFPNNKNTIVN